MEYQAKTLHLSQKFEDLENNDLELTTVLNAFARKGYQLADRDAKKVFILIFKRERVSP